MAQQKIALTGESIELIRQATNQKWRDCQRKDYTIFAIKAKPNFVFANKLEQPKSYKRIFDANKGNPFMHIERVKRSKVMGPFLQENGYYRTEENKVVLCGVCGELWMVSAEKLVSSYTLPDGRMIQRIPDNWFLVRRAGERVPMAMGIQLPRKYYGVYRASWGMLSVNDIASGGHGSGDILVVPKVQGGLDFSNVSPTNNEVFAMTYNQHVGGWDTSGMIQNPNMVRQLSIEKLREVYKFVDDKTDIEKKLKLNFNL